MDEIILRGLVRAMAATLRAADVLACNSAMILYRAGWQRQEIEAALPHAEAIVMRKAGL